ncbi:two-component system activity regulator YycH [Bombilactobacillus bombi]|uniref:two-component system activity regulator YycH n=1 Tax=Bombilactobacillus bombi TaxID=1303590 RepID=UPI0015E5AB6E|nr:two-component system activity regulator YycH [Bombilactobacillus bombi]
MKRFSNIVLRFFLIIAIVISLVLSWLIWTNNAKYQQGVQSGTVQTVNRRTLATTKAMNEIFAPTKIIISQQKTQRLIYNYKYSTVRELFTQFKKARLSNFERISVNDSLRYQQLLHQKNSLQLVYPTAITINTVAHLTAQKHLQQRHDYEIQRIILTLKNQRHYLYFLNDHNFAIYRVREQKLDYNQIQKLIQDNNFSVPVNTQVNAHGVQLLYLKPINLKPVSYLITIQNNNNYISNLLNSKQGADITSHKVDNQTVYRSGMYRLLAVNNKNDEVAFSDYSKTNVPKNVPDLFDETYRSLVKIGNPLNGLYLYSYDRKNQSLLFRNYVEGFPIFQQSKTGSVKIDFSTNGQTLFFSKKILQVPVPAEQKRVRLPATTDIIMGLKDNGFNIHNIQKIVIGYKWSDDSQNHEIVDLTPSYYVKINDQWKTYEDWIS